MTPIQKSLLFKVGDAYVDPHSQGIVLGGVNRDLVPDSPASFKTLVGRQVEIRAGNVHEARHVRDASAAMSIGGGYNFFILVDPAPSLSDPTKLVGGEVWLID